MKMAVALMSAIASKGLFAGDAVSAFSPDGGTAAGVSPVDAVVQFVEGALYFVINSVNSGISVFHDWSASKIGMDPAGGWFSWLFMVFCIGVLYGIWRVLGLLHKPMRENLRGWKWIRIGGIASGLSFFFVPFVCGLCSWQMPDWFPSAVMFGVLVATAVAAVFHVGANFSLGKFKWMAIGLVSCDYCFGLILLSFGAIIVQAVARVLALVIGYVVLSIACGGSKSLSRPGASSRSDSNSRSDAPNRQTHAGRQAPNEDGVGCGKSRHEERKSDMMIARVNGKEVRVMHEDGRLVRFIRCNSEAISAYVSGDRVNVQLANGHSEIYRTDGTIVRRF